MGYVCPHKQSLRGGVYRSPSIGRFAYPSPSVLLLHIFPDLIENVYMYMHLLWGVDVRDIIFIGSFYKLRSECPILDSKNLVTRTSTFLPWLTWTFIHALVMRCGCADILFINVLPVDGKWSSSMTRLTCGGINQI